MDIEKLLKDEREALMRGKVDDVSLLSAKKEKLLSDGSLKKLRHNMLSQLVSCIAHNQRLLEAMIGGVNSAICSLDPNGKNQDPIETYSASGEKKIVSNIQSRQSIKL